MHSASIARLALLLVLLLAACRTPADVPPPTPADDAPPSVFRSVLDERARMITMQLAGDFWVAYSAETGALYRVWPGGVDLDGAVYTTAHGPQPTSVGPAYLVSDDMAPWRLVAGGQEMRPAVRYLGHALAGDAATLEIELAAPGGGTPVTVTETPARVAGPDGGVGLQRTFTTADVPAGTDVALDVYMSSLAAPDAWETDGRFERLGEAGGVVHGRLTLNANGPTTFTSYFGAPAIAPAPGAEGEAKPAGLALIEGSDCAACHNPEVQTVGPSYLAIAERYDDNDLTVVRLANKIIQGGAGAWGDVAMTPHPQLTQEEAKEMTAYILSLDGGTSSGGALDVPGPAYTLTEQRDGTNGLAINLYPVLGDVINLDDLKRAESPFYSGIVPALHAPSQAELGDVQQNVYLEATGFLNVPETANYVIRLVSDDGARLYLDDELLIDNDGLHGPDPKDAELILEEGAHPLRVEYFQGAGGAGLSLQWAKRGDEGFSVIPPEALTYEEDDLREAVAYEVLTGQEERRPGDAEALEDVHPSFAVETIRPSWFEPKVGGLDVMEDGRVVVSTWDPNGSVYILSDIDAAMAANDPEQVRVKRIAAGLAEPLGLKIVDGEIYVLQKQELTRLVDTDGDEVIDRYETVANDWGATANFHEFAFGLVYHEGHFYAALATAILPGGASAQPQNPDRGTVMRIDPETGEVDFIATGLRTPNGIGLARDGELFVADNQGDWLPASKIVHVEEGDFHGSRSVDPDGTAGMEWKRPVVWLPQDEIGNSPSQPARLNVGPYEGQLIHGEVTHGGIKRVFAEEVDGQLQGAVFRFTQGLEAGVNRLAWGPDGNLYVGGVGNPGNWGHVGKLMHGLQRLRYTGDPVFEMLAVRAQPDGFEIEFTEPLAEGVGEAASDYGVEQWQYVPTADYGGPKVDPTALDVTAVEVSEDRRRVRLRLAGMQPDHVVYFRLNDDTMRSEAGRPLWSTEAWYTLNRIPGMTS